MKHLTRNCVALTFLGASAALGAHAADAAGDWTLGEQDGVTFIHAMTEAGPSVMLICSERVGIRASVFLDGDDFESATNFKAGRLAARPVTVDTETTEPRKGDWAYLRTQSKLISTQGWQGKRIYNAAVSGSPVSMDIFKLGETSFSMPAVDDQFKSFSTNCASIS